jgi:hypothetical protein
MTPLEQDSHVYRVGWRGLLSLPLLLLSLGNDTPGCFLPLVLLCWVPELLLSYLKVSSAGLEVRYWPFYQLRARWEEVDRIDKHRVFGIFPSDALFLKQAAPFGSCSILGRELWLRPRLDQRLVVLSDFSGWQDGRLAEDLRLYIPDVMESRCRW